jgi:hypothetical protein
VSTHEGGRSHAPAAPDPTTPAGDFWGVDELDLLLAQPGDGPVARILAAAAAPSDTGHQPGEDAAIAAFRAAFSASADGKPRILGGRMSLQVAAAALMSGLVLSGGAAAAAAGVLPGPVQQTAKAVLAKVGLTVPGPNEDSANDPSDTTPVPLTSPKPTGAPGGASSGKGSEASDLAHSTTTSGVDKGAAVSGATSDGKSKAGQLGKAGTTPTPHSSKPPSSHQPTAPPKHTSTPHPTPTPHPTTPTPHSTHTVAPQNSHSPTSKAGP